MADKDETTGTEQDTSPGKAGQSPGSKSGTPKDKGTLYTAAQITKIKSDAAAMGQGREKKAAEQEKDTLNQELKTTQSRLDALERERDESRLAEARGDPNQLRAYQREQAAAKRERQVEETLRDLTRREGQVKADRAEVDKDRGVVSVAYVAAKHGLEVERLEKYSHLDHETLEKVAEDIAAAKPKGEVGEVEVETPGEEPIVPDTGETTGGGEPTAEQLGGMSMAQYAAWRKKTMTK